MTALAPVSPPKEAPAEATPVDDPVTELLKAAQMEVMAGWCQGSGALSPHGQSTFPGGNDVVAVCAYGAIERAAFRGGQMTRQASARSRLESALNNRRFWGSVINYNDHPARTKEDIVALFERAIREEA